jgi:hypothetical protein
LRPLIYLEFRQLANSIKSLLRSPKRLIPGLIIAIWVMGVLAQNMLTMIGVVPPPLPAGHLFVRQAIPVDIIWAIVFAALAITAGAVVYTALSEGLLIFAPAHIDFLFPTPVQRRNVLVMKLLQDYGKYGFYSGMFFAVLGSPLYHIMNVPVYPDVFLAWLGTLFLIVFVLNVTHTLNIVVTSGGGRRRLAASLVRLGLAGCILVLCATVVAKFVWTSDVFSSIVTSIRSGVLPKLLAPITWATDIILVPVRGLVDERVELFWLFLLAVASTLVLLTREEDIYEPSLGVSARVAKVRSAIRSGDVTGARIHAIGWRGRGSYARSPVPAFGRGAVALLWKSIVVRLRTSGVRLLVIMSVPVVISIIIGSALKELEVRRVVHVVLPYVAWILALMGQQEFRGELRLSNITKSMPVSPAGFIIAQVVYEWLPILVVSGVSAVSLLVFVPDIEPDHLAIAAMVSAAFGFSCTSLVSIPVILYPNAGDKTQDLISHFIGFTLVGFALVPTAVIWIMSGFFDLGTVLASVLIVLVNALISTAAIMIAAHLFARFDPTSD